MWDEMQRPLGIATVPFCLKRVTNMWCDTKKCGVDNSLHVAILWVIWLHRSHSFFNRVPWSGLQVLWRDDACKHAQLGILF